MNDGVIGLEDVTQVKALFKPRSWLAKIEFINHLVLFNNLLINVLAEKNGGKTIFSSILQTNLDPHIKSILIKVKIPCDRANLMDVVATQLHLNHDSRTDFASIVTQVNERKAHALLIIDDAHYLPEELMKEALIALKKQGDFGFFHICLLSDHSTVATLNNLALEPLNQLVHTIDIGSLSEIETKTYSLQRAMLFNFINKPLTDFQSNQFYQQTQGDLAKINGQLEAFILDSPMEKTINHKVILKKTAAALSVASVVGVLYVVGGYINSGTALNAPSMGGAVVAQHSNTHETELTQTSSQIASLQELATRELVHMPLSQKQNLTDKGNDLNVSAVKIINPAVIAKAASVKPDTKVNVISQAKPSFESRLVKFEGFASKKVANQPNTTRFSIQLVETFDQIDLHKLKRKNQLWANTKIRRRGNRYILTLGDFNNLTQAKKAINQLPTELTRQKPWIRMVSDFEQIG